jgi:hypothetical protein
MSYELINLTLPLVITEIENVLEDYPQFPYQIAFSLPEMRQRLLAHVLTHIPNRYVVQGEKLTLKEPKFLHPSPIYERVQMENLIHGGILHLLRENAESIGSRLTQIENLNCPTLTHSR